MDGNSFNNFNQYLVDGLYLDEVGHKIMADFILQEYNRIAFDAVT